MVASSRGFYNIVLLILAAFTRVHQLTYLGQRNAQGLTACDLAAQNGHDDICNLLRVKNPIVQHPQGLFGCTPAVHELSRSPTPTDSLEFSAEGDSESAEENLFHDQTFRPPTPVTDVENLDSLSIGYEPGPPQIQAEFINQIEHSSSAGSGNEADTESLMDEDQFLNESDALSSPSFSPVMSSTAVKAAAQPSVGVTPSGPSSVSPPERPPQQPVKIVNASGDILVDRNAIEKLKDLSYSMQPSSSYKKELVQGTVAHCSSLNPLIKVGMVSPTKAVSQPNNDVMPKLDLSASNKSLNKSIKSLVSEDYELRPANRPPTPARPSLPTLQAGKHDPSSSDSGSSSDNRGRRVTLAAFPRSSSEPKALSLSPPQRSSQEEEDFTDVLDASTKSEGWDALWGSRSRPTALHSEGHVVPLPPIGHAKSTLRTKLAKKAGKGKPESVLNVAKKTLETLETVLSSEEKSSRKKKSLPRSRTIHDMS